VGECSFWYRPTRVVPDQRPLNGCCRLLLSFVFVNNFSAAEKVLNRDRSLVKPTKEDVTTPLRVAEVGVWYTCTL